MSQTEANTVITFEIRSGVSGTNRDHWEVLGTYATGAEASTAKGQMPVVSGHVLAIVRVVSNGSESAGDAKWREREEGRFASGRYKPVLWDWRRHPDRLCDYAGYYPDHFAHIAESDHTKVAFTESDDKGRKDIQKVLSVRDYLERYFPSDDCKCCGKSLRVDGRLIYGMSQKQHEEIIDAMVGTSTEVHYARTAEEIQSIYEESGGTDMSKSSCGSCMGYAARHFNTDGIHPTTVYAAGDLNVAFLRNDDGKLVARALVWPEKLRAGRVYGRAANTLRTALRAAGYARINNDALVGARLRKVPAPGYSDDRYVMPYIDGSQRFEDDASGDYFLISDEGGDYEADRTDGLGYATARRTCDRCDERMDDGDYIVGEERVCYSCYGESYCCHECNTMSFEEELFQIAHPWGRYNGNARVCEECIADHYTLVGEYYYRDNRVMTCNSCSEATYDTDITDGLCEDCFDAREDAEANEDDSPSSPAPAPAHAPEPVASRTLIDWSRPVETVNGELVEVLGHGVVRVGALIGIGYTGPWYYNEYGTANDWLPRLRNVADPAPLVVDSGLSLGAILDAALA